MTKTVFNEKITQIGLKSDPSQSQANSTFIYFFKNIHKTFLAFFSIARFFMI